jgi:hypothetical protein
VVTGEKAVAGAIDEFSGTFANSTRTALMAMAFTSVNNGLDKVPYIRSFGAIAESNVADITPIWPYHEAGDIGVLIVESGGFPVTLASAQGFVQAPDSPVQSSGASGDPALTHLSIWWKRAASGAEANPTVDFIADHVKAQIVVIDSVAASGNPFEDTGSNNSGVSDDFNISFPSGVTTEDLQLIFMVTGISVDENSQDKLFESETWVNADLEYLTVQFKDQTVIGSGSGWGIVTGWKRTAGAFASTTGMLTGGVSTRHANWMGTLRPAQQAAIPLDKGHFTITGKNASFLRHRILVAEKGEFTITGKALDFVIVPAPKQFVLGKGTFSIVGRPLTFRKRFGAWERRESPSTTVWTKKLPVED